MKTSRESDTTYPTLESIRNFITLGAILFPFLPNAYRTPYLILALISLLINRPGYFLRKHVLPFYIFLGIAIFVSFFSPMPLKAIYNTKGILFDIIVPFTFFTFSPLIKRKLFFNYLPAVAIFFFAITLIVFFLYPPGWHVFNRNHSLVGFLSGKLTYAGAISLLAPLLYFKGERKKDITALIAFSLLLINLTVNMSRSYFLGIAGFLLLMIIFERPKIRFLYFGLAVFFALSIFANEKALNYLKESIPEEEHKSSFSRIEMWKTGINIFRAKPLTGIGYELWTEPEIEQELLEKYETSELRELRKDVKLNKAVSGHLHSNYIMALINGGLPLFLALLFIFIYYFSTFYRAPVPWKLQGIGLLIIFFTAGFFEYSFSDAEVIQNFALVLGILTGKAIAGNEDTD